MGHATLYKQYEQTILENFEQRVFQKKSRVSDIYFWLSPIATLIILEILRYPYLSSFFKGNPLFTAAKYALSLLFIYVMQFFLYKVFRGKVVSIYFLNIVLYVLGIASTVTILTTGDPLLPADMLLAKQFSGIISFIKVPWKPYMIISAAVLLLHLSLFSFVHKKHGRRKKYTKRRKLLELIFSMALLAAAVFVFCFSGLFREKVFQRLDITVSGYYTIADYKNNGFILTFFPHMSDLITETPEGYSKETIAEIKEKYPEIKNGFAGGSIVSGVENANVIAIQSESLWDPARMTNISLSEDPLSGMRGLGELFPSGVMVSPVFGCNTCIPEFEFLTGFSSVFLKAGSYPYSQYVHSATDSIAGTFKANGYRTYAIHPYNKYFYNRAKAYPLLGFDEFYGVQDMESPEKKGAYISDMEVTRQIIDIFERSEEPAFIYAITMQNHGNYLQPRYDSFDVNTESDIISGRELAGLKDAVQGVYDADKAFMELVEYFKEVLEPTVIIIYGDHLPFLGDAISTYINSGFLTSSDFAENPQIYETPYLIWANYDIGGNYTPRRVGPAFLGIEAIKLAGVSETPWSIRFFDLFYKKHSGYQQLFVTDSAGEYTQAPDEEMLEDYRLIQYDSLSGSGYVKGAPRN